jgi:hypothetical protein
MEQALPPVPLLSLRQVHSEPPKKGRYREPVLKSGSKVSSAGFIPSSEVLSGKRCSIASGMTTKAESCGERKDHRGLPQSRSAGSAGAQWVCWDNLRTEYSSLKGFAGQAAGESPRMMALRACATRMQRKFDGCGESKETPVVAKCFDLAH